MEIFNCRFCAKSRQGSICSPISVGDGIYKNLESVTGKSFKALISVSKEKTFAIDDPWFEKKAKNEWIIKKLCLKSNINSDKWDTIKAVNKNNKFFLGNFNLKIIKEIRARIRSEMLDPSFWTAKIKTKPKGSKFVGFLFFIFWYRNR